MHHSFLLTVKQPAAHICSTLADYSTLKMEAIRSSETSVNPSSTQRHIPEDNILHSHRFESLIIIIIIIIIINFALPFGRLSVFARDIRVLSFVNVCPSRIALLPDALRLQTSFLGTLTFFETKLFLLIIVYSGTFSGIKY
jgi:hypothetical protein